VELEEAARELYAAGPGDFVGRRTELSKQARDEGNKDLAAEIKKLPKPVVAAWVVNMLVRHEPEQVDQVLTLGMSLREAQTSMAGEELRQLGKQRRRLIAAVTRQARSIAAELGQKVGEGITTQVEETLHAAMVDEGAAAAVRTALLVKPLTSTGVEQIDARAAVAVPSLLGQSAPPMLREAAPERPELSVVPDNSKAIEEAEGAVRAAEQALAVEERSLQKATQRVEKREAKELQLRAEREELLRRIDDLETRLEANEDELAEAEERREAAQESVKRARADLEDAQEALSELR
jgi:DNA repair exonuclease SbcCD ATPase subunit